MAVDDPLNGSQSYSSAFKLFGKMQALKDAKQLVHISHIEAGAIVPHEDLDLTLIPVGRTDLNFCQAPHPREFDRIGNEIDDYQFQHGTVSIADRKRADRPCNVPILRLLRDLRNDLADELLQIDRRLLGLGPPDPG